MNPVIPQGPGPGPAFDASLVCAVIVTYGPEPALLRRVVDSVLQQVGHLVVFDNGSTGVDVDELLAGRGDQRGCLGAQRWPRECLEPGL